MFRMPIGPYGIGNIEYDTPMVGEGAYARSVSLLVFYPATESGEGTAWASQEDAYPVILLQHGLMGNQHESSVLVNDLVSCGYVVVSIGHAYGSSGVIFPGEKSYEQPAELVIDRHKLTPLGRLWEEDMQMVLQEIPKLPIADKLDLKCGYTTLGVSFGGCISVTMALGDERIKRAINLDGGMFVECNPKQTGKPILIICSPFNYLAYGKLQEFGCSHLEVVKVKKIAHWEFSDGVYLSERGKKNREWADRVSKTRAELCLDFIKRTTEEYPK